MNVRYLLKILSSFIGLLFLAMPTSHAFETIDPNESLTIYVWLADATEPMKGQCYEIDQKTRGERFNTKVYTSRCRPKKPGYKWIPDPSGMSGKCYEVHPETGAQGFSYKVSTSECIPENAEFLLADGQCFAKGIMKDGTEFLSKTIMDDCRPQKMTYEFTFDPKMMRGTCIGKDSTGASEYVRRVELTRCKPKLTTYVYDESKNKCYEVDAANGPEGYLNTASISKCLDKKAATYAFMDGKCFEKSLGPDGQEVVLPTSLQKCRPDKTQYSFEFQSRYNGICYEVDSLTLGEQYKGRVDLSFCRPSEVVTFYVPELRQCVEIDTETRGQKFAARTKSSDCESYVAGPSWVASQRNLYEGKCVMKLKKATGEVVDDTVLDERCEPKETRYDWIQDQEFDGKCYRVDAKHGPRVYSHMVADRECYPSPQKLVYRQDPKSFLGRCLIVDAATEGERFRLQVNARRCKEDMGLVSPSP